MTQTPPVAWLVDVPANDPYGKTCFISACRGNSDIAEALSYFLFAASKEVEQKKANASDPSITIKRNLETIARHLEVSPKTAIAYIRKLTEWKFIIAHGYHHTYDVYHHEVEQAMQTPPTPEWPKPRGKHAKQSEDCRDGRFTIHAEDCRDGKDCKDERINALEERIVDLTSQIVILQTQMVNLQSRMSDLQSVQSSESTPQEAREAQIDPLVITNNYSDITEDNIYVNASALTRTPSQETSSENESHYQHSDGSSAQDIHSEQQASTAIPIATTKPQTELIGVATRNTDSLVDVTQVAAPNKQRGSRKPKVTKPEDESMEKRIDAVLNCLDELGTEYAGEEFHYSRFKTDRESVKTLLTSWQNLSREQVQATYRFMMDTPKSDDGWLWSDHMSVKAFCNNFATQYARMRKKCVPNGQTNKETKAPSAAIAAGYTDYTNTPPTNYKPLPRKRA